LLNSKIEEQIFEGRYHRLLELIEYYNIPVRSRDKWLFLSWALASELGLMKTTLDKGRGRPGKDYLDLVEKVDAIKARRGGGTRDAIKILQKTDPKYKDQELKNLTNRYVETSQKFWLSLTSRRLDFLKAAAANPGK
jgi:hypothetical protein